ncbi:tryptophan-associated transmembrane protein [Herbihabitans rhizosphaerae]|uniref:Tryptophan-associated transmembrane protein n=1 Tax=Herbihabitans rhizosphaerae TaxID=1872711 RepID=A0A4Q7KGP9_9PSEU|nr:tryptophan-associated transmembrane protein [Herbihabitans rhizosphaerae]
MGGLLLGSVALWGSSRLDWERPGALVPLALLALAGIAGLIATAGLARRVLGAVLALAGLAAAWLAVAADGGFAPRGLAVAGGLLIVTGGVLVVRHAADLPRLGARYQASNAKPSTDGDPDADLWRALSEGRDPTEGRS